MDRKLKSEINRLAHKAGLAHEAKARAALMKAATAGDLKSAAEIAAFDVFPDLKPFDWENWRGKEPPT